MRNSAFLVLVTLSVALAICKPLRAASEGGDGQGQLKQLEAVASRVFAVDPASIEERAQERNFLSFRSGGVVVSRRNDSRTFFVDDERYQGSRGAEDVMAGSDEELVRAARDVLGGLDIPEEEIAQARVLTEKLQTGQYDPAIQSYRPGEVRDGRRLIEMTRTVRSLPVFSSRALVGLTRDRRVGFLEAHWPEIPDMVLAEATRLQELVKTGWAPPQPYSGSRVESVEAGVIHSPAIAFVMDIYPAIRVVLVPESEQVGKKGILYLDERGQPVPVPRTFEAADQPPPAPTGRAATPR
jgi:hypothetical protein